MPKPGEHVAAPADRDRAAQRRWRLELGLLGLCALAVRVGYVLAYKHPFAVGGDAYFYQHGANLLVDGHGFIDPYRYKVGIVAQSADHPPGTILVLAGASLFGMRSVFWHQLQECLLGAGTVVVIAIIARQLAGRRAAIIAGVIAVVYPNLWFNDGMVMSETIIQLTTALAVLAAYRWWAAPSRKGAVWLGLAVGACALARAEAVALVVFLLGPLILLDRRHRWRERIAPVAMAGAVAVAVLVPWVAYNVYRFEQPVALSTGFDQGMAVSNCDATYYGPFVGYWSWPCIQKVPVPAASDSSEAAVQYRHVGFAYLRSHEARVPAVVAARVLRTWALFRPVQQIQLDTIETRELGFSKLALGMYYALSVGTVAGVWVLRRRRVALSPILAPIAVVTLATAVTFGQTRYRASAEVVLVLGAAVALAALRLPRRGLRGRGPGRGRGRSGLDDAPPPTERPQPESIRAIPGQAEPAPDPVAAPVALTPVTLAGGRTRRFPCFDGLRAVAALSVVLVHTSFPSGVTARHSWGAYTARLEIGVAVFFAISGFLLYRPFVAAHLSGRPGPALGPYFKRRLLRIVPAYWVTLAVAAYVLHTVKPIHDLKSVIMYFGFLQIYSRHTVLGGITAAWTLCVEMSFYLFLPVYAAGVARWAGGRERDRLRAQALGLGGLFLASTAFKLVVFAVPAIKSSPAATWLPAQLDLFVFGMALALASVWWSDHGREPVALRRGGMPVVAWAAAATAFWAVSTRIGLPRLPLFPETLGQVFGRQWLYGSFAFFLLLPAVFGPQDVGVVRALLRARPMVALGLVSYGVYLWHETWITKVLVWLHQPLFHTSFVELTVAVAGLSVLCAGASYLLVEQPFQRLGRRRRPPVPAGTRPAAPLVDALQT